MRALSRLADLMILNILTFVCCIPIVTIGASLTSMHYVLLKMVRDEDSYIFKSYFKSFKENFKQATLLWLIVLAATIVIAVDVYIMNNSTGFPQALIIAIFAAAVFLYIVAQYIFPLQSKFVNNIGATLKNAVLMTILGLPRSLGMFGCSLIPIACLYFFDMKCLPFLILFGFSGPGYLQAMLYNKLFARFEPEKKDEVVSEAEELAAAIRAIDDASDDNSLLNNEFGDRDETVEEEASNQNDEKSNSAEATETNSEK